MTKDYQPLIVVGAAGSGTRMLRDLLAQLPGCGTWRVDDTNFIWRHGNEHFASDELTADLVTDAVRRHIRRQFYCLAASRNLNTVVERSYANCLRLAFVDRVFPEARFVHLVRDGRDAAVAARERWQARPHVMNALRQARYMPLRSVAVTMGSYLSRRLGIGGSGKGQPVVWGPRYTSLYEDLRHGTLLEVCAMQWKQCVDAATQYLRTLPRERFREFKYEEFVTVPEAQLMQIAEFAQVPLDAATSRRLTAAVRASHIGQGRELIDAEQFETLEVLLEDTLKAHGYELFFTPETPRLHLEGASGDVRNPQSVRRRAG